MRYLPMSEHVRTQRRNSRHGLATALVVVSFVAASSACNTILDIPEVERRVVDTGDAAALVEAAPPNDGAPVVCGPEQKLCGGACVSAFDPNTGCASPSCVSCAAPHATVACVAGLCAVVACEEGFANCNAAANDGCEADLRSDQANCNTCGNDCGAFRCTKSECACVTADSCGFGGTCANQLCVCGGNTCPSGSKCEDMDSCGP